MTCEKIQEMLPAYQDGELSAENEKAVKAHLEECAACQREEQLLPASWEMLGELKPIEPSPDFQARFWARVRQEEAKQTGWRVMAELATAYACGLGARGSGGYLDDWGYGRIDIVCKSQPERNNSSERILCFNITIPPKFN